MDSLVFVRYTKMRTDPLIAWIITKSHEENWYETNMALCCHCNHPS